MANINAGIRFTTNAKEIEKEIDNIDKRLAKLQNSKAELQIKADKLDETSKKLKEVDLDIKKLQAQRAELKINSKQGDEAKSKMVELNNAINVMKAAKAQLNVDAQKVKGADAELKKVNTEMNSLNNKKAFLEVQHKDVKDAEEGAKNLREGLDKIDSSKTSINISSNIQEVGGALDSLGSKMLGVAKKAAVAGATMATTLGVKAGKEIIGAAMEMEKMQASLESLTGSAEAARTMFGHIDEFSMASAFSGADISSVSRNFLSVGKDVEETYTWLKRTGDVAGATGADMSGLGLVFSQVVANGKLNGQDWLQIINNSAGGLKQYIIAASEGAITQENFSDKMSESKISAELFTKAIDLATSEGGLFFKGTERQAETLSGRLSNLAESLLNIGMKITGINKKTSEVKEGGIYDIISKDVQGLIEMLDNNSDKIAAFADKIEETIISLYNGIKSFDWQSFGEGVKEGFGGLKDSVKSFYDTAKPLIDLAKAKITELGEGSFAKGLGELPALLLKWAIGIKGVGLAIKGLGGLTGIIGKLTGFSLGSLFGGKGGGEVKTTTFDTGKMLTQFKNLALIAGVIGNVMLAAEAIKQVNEKVPDNLGSIGKKLVTIGIAIAGMGALVAVAGKLTDGEGMATALAGLATIALISAELMLAAEAMKQIDEKVPEIGESFALKLASIAAAILGMGALTAVMGFLVANPLGALVGAAGFVAIAAISAELVIVSNAIAEMDAKVPEDLSSVTTKLENITAVIKQFSTADFGGLMGILNGIVNVINAEVATTAMQSIISLAEELKKFDEEMEGLPENSDIEGKLKTITDAVETIHGANLGGVLDALAGMASGWNVSETSGVVEKLTELIEILKNFHEAMAGLPDDTDEKVKAIEEAVKAISEAEIPKPDIYKTLVEVTKAVTELVAIADAMTQLETDFSPAMVRRTIDNIVEVVEKLQDVKEKIGKSSGFVSADTMRAVTETAKEMLTLISSLHSLAGAAYSEDVLKKIQRVGQAILALAEPGLKNAIENSTKKADVTTVSTAVGELITLAENLHTLASTPFTIGVVTTRIADLKHAIAALNSMPELTAQEISTTMVDSLVNLTISLKNLAGDFESVGEEYGDKIVEGFENAKIADGCKKEINKVIEALKTLKSKFEEIGKSYGTTLKNAFSNAVRGMATVVEAQITLIENYSTKLSTIGTTLGNSLARSFNEAISNMAESVNTQISSIQGSLNGLNTSITPDSPLYRATGGEVQYRAEGGSIFKPRGTDTVPAMLTPGEFVVRKEAVNKLGTPFMQKVNSLNIPGALSRLIGNFGTHNMSMPSANYYNNITHNNTRDNHARVTINTKTNNPNYIVRRQKRWAGV